MLFRVFACSSLALGFSPPLLLACFLGFPAPLFLVRYSGFSPPLLLHFIEGFPIPSSWKYRRRRRRLSLDLCSVLDRPKQKTLKTERTNVKQIFEVYHRDFFWGWGFALAFLSHMCVLGYSQKKVCVECNGFGSRGESVRP
jgi:hypothetical protein